MPISDGGYFLQREGERAEPLWLRPYEFKHILGELPRPVVLVNGAFDLLHSGHMRLLYAARRKAATLVCAVDSDSKVRKAKGPGRPVLTLPERLTTLGYMPINYLVEVGDELEMWNLVQILKPELRVLGEEYRCQPTKYPGVKRMFVRMGPHHTTDIIKKMQVQVQKGDACNGK